MKRSELRQLIKEELNTLVEVKAPKVIIAPKTFRKYDTMVPRGYYSYVKTDRGTHQYQHERDNKMITLSDREIADYARQEKLIIENTKKNIVSESLVPFKKVKDMVYNEMLGMYKQLDPDADFETDLKNEFKKIKNVDDLLSAMDNRDFGEPEDLLNWIIK